MTEYRVKYVIHIPVPRLHEPHLLHLRCRRHVVPVWSTEERREESTEERREESTEERREERRRGGGEQRGEGGREEEGEEGRRNEEGGSQVKIPADAKHNLRLDLRTRRYRYIIID